MGQRLPGYRLQTVFGSPEQNFGLPSLLPKQQFIYFSTERSINIDFIFSVHPVGLHLFSTLHPQSLKVRLGCQQS